MQQVVLVALGGAAGSALRYLTTVAAVRWFGADFPFGTLAVNLVGSFCIGLVQELATDALVLSPDARLLLSTGVMGGLTTYSAFSYETVRLFQVGAWHSAGINFAVTTVLCFALCVLGMATGRLLLSLRG